jgi:hypothetical protein
MLGGMAEWFKAAVLKTVFRRRNVGSNPTPSAIRKALKPPNHFWVAPHKQGYGEMAE